MEEPHLLLLDLYMPVMDGFDLLDRVKRHSDTSRLPVIVITGDPKIETRDKVFQMGAEDYIVKPLHIEDMIPRVKRFIS